MITGAVEAAIAQLTELEQRSGGALQVLAHPDDADRADTVVVSIETGIAAGRVAGGGIRVRARERFEIVVPGAFPFEPPMVWTEHRRWAGTRHVQWARHLCLYSAPSVEWVPADGMRGLINRLLVWLERAAAGTLDPDGQPLHPPAAYPSAPGCVVVHPNVGNRVPSANSGDARTLVQFAWCVRDHDRIDVLYWLSKSQVVDRANKKRATPVNAQGLPYFVALVVNFADEIAWEYPNRAGDLAARLADMGYASTTMMFGPRRVGKTSLLAAMINEINELNVNSPVRLEVDLASRSRLQESLQKMMALPLLLGDGLGKPVADSDLDPRTYRLYLRKKNEKDPLEIVFYDYPGEYVVKNLDKVRDRLHGATVLIVAIDTPALMNSDGDWRWLHEQHNHPGALTDLLADELRTLTGQGLETLGTTRLVLFVPLKCERWLATEADTAALLQRVRDGYARVLDLLDEDFYRPDTAVVIAPIQTIGSIAVHAAQASDAGLRGGQRGRGLQRLGRNRVGPHQSRVYGGGSRL